MTLKVTFAKAPKAKSDIAFVPVYEGCVLSAAAKELDKTSKGILKTAIENAPLFEGKAGQICGVAMPKGAAFKRIIALGFGDVKKQDKNAFETMGGNLLPALQGLGTAQPSLFICEEKKSSSEATISPNIKSRIKNQR